jgi:hypothetical protein
MDYFEMMQTLAGADPSFSAEYLNQNLSPGMA